MSGECAEVCGRFAWPQFGLSDAPGLVELASPRRCVMWLADADAHASRLITVRSTRGRVQILLANKTEKLKLGIQLGLIFASVKSSLAL